MMVVGENTLLAQRKKRAMSKLILGFQGLLPPLEVRTLIKEHSPAGFILFQRNVESLEQVVECNERLRRLAASENPPLISVDQEGGRVRRIKDSDWPAMRWLGNIDDIDTTKKVIAGINKELLALGFNANWAPCSDVDQPDKSLLRSFICSRSTSMCPMFEQASNKCKISEGRLCQALSNMETPMWTHIWICRLLTKTYQTLKFVN